MGTDTNSAVHADWTKPANRFGTDNEDAMVDYEDECLSCKWGPQCLINAPPSKRVFIEFDRSHDQHRYESAYYVQASLPASTGGFHLRSDANALETAGRQDGQQKGSNDSAATAVSISSVRKLTQARGHEDFVRWSQTLNVFSCSIPMGVKVLNGNPLLVNVLFAKPDTHDMAHDSGGKVAIYTGFTADEKKAANA